MWEGTHTFSPSYNAFCNRWCTQDPVGVCVCVRMCECVCACVRAHTCMSGIFPNYLPIQVYRYMHAVFDLPSTNTAGGHQIELPLLHVHALHTREYKYTDTCMPYSIIHMHEYHCHLLTVQHSWWSSNRTLSATCICMYIHV